MLDIDAREKIITHILRDGKQRAGIETLGVTLRRFSQLELGSMWHSNPARNYYPDVEQGEANLLFVGDHHDGYSDYDRKLVYAGFRQGLQTAREFPVWVIREMSRNAHGFPEHESLRRFLAVFNIAPTI